MRLAWTAGAAMSVVASAAAAQGLPPILTGSPSIADGNQRCSELLARSATLRKQLEAPASAPTDLGAAYRKYRNTYGPIPIPAWSNVHASFSQLAGHGAAYYTYRWCKVIADDLFTRFAKEGLRNPRTAADYRRLVLARAGPSRRPSWCRIFSAGRSASTSRRPRWPKPRR
jgi:hypothetical protein